MVIPGEKMYVTEHMSMESIVLPQFFISLSASWRQWKEQLSSVVPFYLVISTLKVGNIELDLPKFRAKLIFYLSNCECPALCQAMRNLTQKIGASKFLKQGHFCAST